MFSGTVQATVWADEPESTTLLERLNPFSRRSLEPVDYTVGLEESRNQNRPIVIDVETTQYFHDENLPSAEHVEDRLDPYYQARHDEFLGEALDFHHNRNSAFLMRPFSFLTRRPTSSSFGSVSLELSIPLDSSAPTSSCPPTPDYRFGSRRNSSANICGICNPPAEEESAEEPSRDIKETVIPIEARMSGDSVRYFDEENYERRSSNTRSVSISKPWTWKWWRMESGDVVEDEQEQSEARQRSRSSSIASLTSAIRPLTWVLRRFSIESSSIASDNYSTSSDERSDY